MLSSLPPLWSAALELIRDHNRGYIAVLGVPGARSVLDNLVSIGLVDYSHNGRFCTLTPLAAERMGLILYEWKDECHARWATREKVKAIEDSRRGRKSLGDRMSATNELGIAERDEDWAAFSPREWFTDGDGDVPEPEPVTDDYDNVVTLFEGVTLYRDDDLKRAAKAEAKAKREQKKQTKAAKRKLGRTG